MREEAVVVIKLDAAELPRQAAAAGQALGQIGKAGEVSARQTAAAMRQLPAQMTDIATQLAGGANPLLVLMQQGGQIKDSFGGVGAAIRGLGAAITPTAVAVGGAALAVGVLGGAAVAAAREESRLDSALLLTGNAAGLTSGRLEALATATAQSTGVTVSSAREIAIALASTGMVSGTVLPTIAKAVARVSEVSGETADSVAKDFAAMRNGVADWAAEHNKSWNFITAAEYRRIAALEDMGKAEEAQLLVGRKVLEHLGEQERAVGGLAGAWRDVKGAFNAFWEAQKQLFRDTPETRRQAGLQRLARARAGSGGGLLERLLFGTPEEALAEIELANRDALRDAERGIASSDTAQREAAEIARIRNARAGRNAGAGRRERPYIPGEFQVLDARDAMVLAARRSAEQQQIDAFFAEKTADADEREQRDRQRRIDREADADEREQRDRQRRIDREADFLQQLVDANARAGAELVEDARERGEAMIRVDREIAQRRLTEMGLGAQARAEAERLLDEQALDRRRKLQREIEETEGRQAREAGRETYGEVRGALMAAFRDTRNPVQAFARTLGAAVYARMTAALADSIATTLVGSDGRGGWLQLALNYIGGISGGGLTVDTGGYGIGSTRTDGGVGVPTRGGMATGTNYVPRDMVVKVHRGEAIVPARYNPAAGGAGAPQINVTVNGPVAAEQVALTEATVARAMARAYRRAAARA